MARHLSTGCPLNNSDPKPKRGIGVIVHWNGGTEYTGKVTNSPEHGSMDARHINLIVGPFKTKKILEVRSVVAGAGDVQYHSIRKRPGLLK